MPSPSFRHALASLWLAALPLLAARAAQAAPAPPPTPSAPAALAPSAPPAPSAPAPPLAPSAALAPSALPAPSAPVAPAGQPASAGAGSPERCPAGALERLHREAPSFLVEVHARQGSTATTGVVIAPDRVIVTTGSVIDEGWPITVYFADGARSAARIQHYDAGRQFAVLALEAPPPGLAPRPLAAAMPALGAPLLTAGGPLHRGHKVAWEVRQATLTNALDDAVMASPAPPAGSPLLTCEGEIVGIQGGLTVLASGHWMRDLVMAPAPFATTALTLRAMSEGKKERTFGTFQVLGGLQLTLPVRKDEMGVGFRLKLLELSIQPSLFFAAHVGAQWLSVPDGTTYATSTDVTRWRQQFEMLVGYRLRANIGSPSEGFGQIDVVPFAGLATRIDFTTLTRLNPDRTTRRETVREEHLDPLVGLSLGMLGGNMTYSFQLDTKEPGRSIHTIGFGHGF